jgi:hypothetical protein
MKTVKKNPSTLVLIACLFASNQTVFAHEQEQSPISFQNAAVKSRNPALTEEDAKNTLPFDKILFQTLSEDENLFKLADLIVRASPKVSRVWSGYWSPNQPFVLLRPKERALLVSYTTPPAEYVLQTGDKIPSSIGGRVYFHQNYPAIEANGDLNFRIAKHYAPALEPQLGVGSETKEFRQLNYLFHEWFHGFQNNGLFAKSPAEPSVFFGKPMVPASQTSDPKFTEMAELERRILSASLQTSSKKELRSMLKQYLAVRFQRTQNLPDVQFLERHFERYEGTALLVGIQAAVAATGLPPEKIKTLIQTELARELKSFPSAPTPDSRLMRWRLYGTGAAIGLLLDTLKFKWRKPIEKGVEPLDALLAKAVRFDSANAEIIADEAGKTFRKRENK